MFQKLIATLLGDKEDPLAEGNERLALSALLVRIARSDHDYSAQEVARIERIIMTRFGLSEMDAGALRKDAETLEAEAPDTVRFTRAIKECVAYEARLSVVEALWQVALCDGARDPQEDALIRMCVSLLGIRDQDSAMARQRAMS